MPRLAADTKAIADVEKAIKAYEKTHEKAQAAEQKADEARAAEQRSLRELRWYANHPDLPDDFDLDEFRKSLEQPFEDGGADPGPDTELEAVLSDEDREVDVTPADEDADTSPDLDAADEDDDDPFGDD